MPGRTKHLLAPALIAGVGIFALGAPASAQQTTPATPEPATCKATIAPQALQAQTDPFQLRVALTQDIGDVSAATIQEENSGLQVSVKKADEDAAEDVQEGAAEPATEESPEPTPVTEPQTTPATPATPAPKPAAPAADAAAAPAQVVWLNLNASVAQPGDYTLQLTGANGTCQGTVSIQPSGGSK